MNVQFTERRPAFPLMSYVQTYWQGDFNTSNEEKFSQSVLPNGCVEIIIHLTSDHCALSENGKTWNVSPEFTLLGVYDKPYDVVFDQNVKVFGIRLFPDGMANIFGVPPKLIMSSFENVNDVFGDDFRVFSSKIRDLKDFDDQVALANQFIGKKLSNNVKSYDYTHLAMELIRKTNGLENYNDLVNQVPISQRQLQREFKNLYGISIRDYMRLARLNAIHEYMQNNAAKLTALSYDLNFTDQSHLIKEYKTFSGVTPKALLKNRGAYIINTGSE